MAKQIRILRCHEDDFFRHPGWWAEMDDPQLAPGELVKLVFDTGRAAVAALVTAVTKGSQPGIFTHGYRIEYRQV